MENGTLALQDAEKCVELNPTWARGLGRKGAALFLLERYDEAVEVYEAALKLEPANEGFKQSLAQAEAAAEESGAAAGAQIFGQFAKFFQGDIATRCALSPATADFAKDNEFLDICDKIKSNPNSIMQHLQNQKIMTFIQVMMQQETMAKRRAEGKPEVDPELARAMMEQRERKAREEDEANRRRKEADEKYKKEQEEKKKQEEISKLSEEQRKAIAVKEEGNVLYKARKFDDALAKYREAASLDPENMVYHSNIAAVFFEMGKFDECIAECNSAVEIGRRNRADFKLIGRALARIGNAYAKQDKLDEAIEWYTKALTDFRDADTLAALRKVERTKEERAKQAYINPELSTKAKEEGNQFFKEQKYPEAIKAYSEAIKRDPSNPVNYSNRAAAYTKLAEYRLAVKDCDDALALDPKMLKAILRKGNAQYFMKEYSKCLTTYDEALKIDPENEEAKSGMNKVIMAIQNNNGDDEEVRRRAMSDPEVRQILDDPAMQAVLQQMQQDPKAAAHHLRNPEIARRINKLRAAGIVS
jgi:stress-induced-phosphoprotein 1